jgi:hypothetical protein
MNMPAGRQSFAIGRKKFAAGNRNLEKESQYVESLDTQNQTQQTHYDTEDMDSLGEEDTGEDTEAENLGEE